MYSTIDALVLCSNSEGLPMSILEAMSYGLPVISTNVGAIPKVINHEVNGFLIPPKDSNALANILKNFIDNQYNLNNIGEEAQHYIAKNYSIEQVAQDYNLIYQKL